MAMIVFRGLDSGSGAGDRRHHSGWQPEAALLAAEEREERRQRRGRDFYRVLERGHSAMAQAFAVALGVGGGRH